MAAALVLGGALALGDLRLGGIAYLGVACSVSFVGTGGPRSRAARVAAQAVGAAAGMTLGTVLPSSPAWVIAGAVAVGVLAGALGGIGPATTGGAVMAVIGLAYTQFDRLALPWWQPVLAYLFGSALLLTLALIAARHTDRRAVAAVFDDAAQVADDPDDDGARHRLAAASAAAREAAVGYRLRPGPLAAVWADARAAADQAARIAARPADRGREERDDLGRGWRVTAAALRARSPRPADRPPPRSSARRAISAAARSTLRQVMDPFAVWTGARIGLCVGTATALALVLHTPAHAFWIPLTVAVVVRPEYGAVLTRSVHRLAGTVVGVAAVALLLAFSPGPVWIAAVAATSLGLAAFGAPRLYGLAVVGITGSALLSVALSAPAGFDPWARLLDTALACAIALLVGVLAWPRRGLPDQLRAYAQVTAALAAYAKRPGQESLDEAYRQAHRWRAQLDRDAAEPDPAHAATDWLPVAHRLEHLVDELVASPDHRDIGQLLRTPVDKPADAAALLARISAASQAARGLSGEGLRSGSGRSDPRCGGNR